MSSSNKKSSEKGDKVTKTEETESEEDDVFPDILENDEEAR